MFYKSLCGRTYVLIQEIHQGLGANYKYGHSGWRTCWFYNMLSHWGFASVALPGTGGSQAVG